MSASQRRWGRSWGSELTPPSVSSSTEEALVREVPKNTHLHRRVIEEGLIQGRASSLPDMIVVQWKRASRAFERR
ncbi:hypothetical protein [Microbacterium sp. Cr-K32]|uniref:hypothetical protein n=1 Tax=Microbacterium sp. Cr-K32 TaxID=1452535 RepID=UPI0004934432|nr:hypothetical protein [Microbacterium sp. Cr-K32]